MKPLLVSLGVVEMYVVLNGRNGYVHTEVLPKMEQLTVTDCGMVDVKKYFRAVYSKKIENVCIIYYSIGIKLYYAMR